MATMKDVAKAAGVSPTTVSLIINGKVKDGRISAETEKKVYQVMRELNYHPNMSARRLRTDESLGATVAFYWPSDYRSNILSSFITTFPTIREELGFDVDLVIRSYKNEELDKVSDPIVRNNYNGVIIGGPSAKDVEYLETLDTRTPIVILNRESERHSTVSSDNLEMGFLAARLIKNKGYTDAAVIISPRPKEGAGQRVDAFMRACEEIGIRIDPGWVFKTDTSLKGGAEAASAFCGLSDRPRVIFCETDFMALGALHELHRQNLRVPDDVEVLAIQFLSDDYMNYSIPSLTTLVMPAGLQLKEALRIIRERITDPTAPPTHTLIPASIEVRESF